MAQSQHARKYVQGVRNCVAPSVAERSLKTAVEIGLIGNNGEVTKVWEMVEKDIKETARVAAAPTIVRLEKKEKEFIQA